MSSPGNAYNSPGGTEPDGQAQLPSIGDLINALALMTRLPLAAPDVTGWHFAQAALFFPVLGLIEGILLVLLSRLMIPDLSAVAASTLLVLAWEGLSAPLANPAEEPELRWHIPLDRAPILLASLALKAALLRSCGTLVPAALLFSPVLGRWSFVVLAVGARSADQQGRKFSPAVSFREFGVASLLAFLVVFTLGQFVGLVLIIVTAAITLLLRLGFHRWQGGVTWETVVAGMHIVEISALAAMAILG